MFRSKKWQIEELEYKLADKEQLVRLYDRETERLLQEVTNLSEKLAKQKEKTQQIVLRFREIAAKRKSFEHLEVWAEYQKTEDGEEELTVWLQMDQETRAFRL